MTLGAGDIAFILSGGSSNTNPLLSLGGMPSSSFVNGGLFNDLTDVQLAAGYTDYRCLYIANDNNTETLVGASIYIDDEAVGGVDLQVGFLFRNDIQRVNIVNGTAVTGGTFTVLYETTDVVVSWDASVATWAGNFQTALRAVSGLEDVTVSWDVSGTTVIFTVHFVGGAGNRYHPILEVVSGISPGSLSIFKVFDGSPLNSVADETDAVTTAPNNIIFSSPTPTSPLLLGDLRATDIVPVWVRRVAAVGQSPLSNDGFALKLTGTP